MAGGECAVGPCVCPMLRPSSAACALSLGSPPVVLLPPVLVVTSALLSLLLSLLSPPLL